MPGTTGSVVYFRPTAAALLTQNFQTGAVLYLPFRAVSGIFSTGGAVTTANALLTLKAWLPSARTPVVQEGGLMAPQWYRFFDYLVNFKLGGAEAPTITDVSNTVSGVQTAMTQTVSAVVSLSEQTNQNASALATTIEVSQNNALTGSAQIPAVQRAPRDFFDSSENGR